MGQRDLLVSITMDQDFPGKATYCRHVLYFLFRLLTRVLKSIEKEDTVISKVAKGKGKTRGKNGKNWKMC